MSTEDELISRILGVTLTPGDPDDSSYGRSFVRLTELSQELIDEGAESLLLTKDLMDRALMTRLMLPKEAGVQRPVPYLMDVYSRAAHELRATSRDKASAEQAQDIALNAQDLALSHTFLAITTDMFPQSAEIQQRGALQLLDALNARGGDSSPYIHSSAMPSGFLEQFAAKHVDEEGFSSIISTILSEINLRLLQTTILGAYQQDLQHLMTLASIPLIAQTMTQLPGWSPVLKTGRGIERTILGPAFCVTSIPDLDIFFDQQLVLAPAEPEAANTLFRNVDTLPRNEVASAITSVRFSVQALRTMLFNLIMLFLRPQTTREATLRWLALAVESNWELSKEMPRASEAAPRGFMLNLSAVLLKSCQPFLDPTSGKAWGKIDSRYMQTGTRLSFEEDTRLHLSPEEARALKARLASNSAAGPSKASPPHFICECYFLTARALHLGYIKSYSFTQQISRVAGESRDTLQRVRQAMDSSPLTGPHQAIAAQQLEQIEKHHARLAAGTLCMQSELMEKELSEAAFAFYRLTAAWLLREASPSFRQGLPPDLPLPEPAPESFRALPEFLVQDLVDLIKFSFQFREPLAALEQMPLDELVMFLIAFMPAGNYVNNIYLRAQLGEVLGYLLPQEDQADEDQFRSRRRPRYNPLSSNVALMLDTNLVVQKSLVPTLLKLFVEIERTGRHNQFYEKFEVRLDIGRILMRLWSNPIHHEAWLKLAEADQDLYSRFNYFLETDATLHLDDALKLLQEERDFEQLPEGNQRQEQQRHRSGRVRFLRFHLYYATMMLRIIRMTTAVIYQPWLQPQAAKRVAGTLNYFLKFLTGPEQKKLRLSDPRNEVKFDPRELLTQIAAIYVNLARRDSSGRLVQAVVADKRSFFDNMFVGATAVLRKHALLLEADIVELDRLHLATSQAAAAMDAEDAAEADAPEEFFDPIMSELMSDPVTLPSGVDVERESILRHMMSDPTDPFSRAPLTEASLKPNVELKARIEQWKAEHMQGGG